MNSEKLEQLKQLSKNNFSKYSKEDKNEIKTAYKTSMKGLLTTFAIEYTNHMAIDGAVENNADIFEFINDWVESRVDLRDY